MPKYFQVKRKHNKTKCARISISYPRTDSGENNIVVLKHLLRWMRPWWRHWVVAIINFADGIYLSFLNKPEFTSHERFRFRGRWYIWSFNFPLEICLYLPIQPIGHSQWINLLSNSKLLVQLGRQNELIQNFCAECSQMIWTWKSKRQ
jgi:hypothetical protein